ncbi:hypothetical protein NIIDNTM18_42090 [Mycolicibacterium litorale]|uniref:Uncharacterized protein n=1 Tax=Mycolicibacterium litorale TaxID=758802 RepID=A0A6S6PB28_9MYCO|nr:hypothetical protein [Mycolicibacterium litorale]BCI54931.1 hypothetical protein NIIDNTM18_42090 [Mycolicibacterium litorale]
MSEAVRIPGVGGAPVTRFYEVEGGFLAVTRPNIPGVRGDTHVFLCRCDGRMTCPSADDGAAGHLHPLKSFPSGTGFEDALAGLGYTTVIDDIGPEPEPEPPQQDQSPVQAVLDLLPVPPEIVAVIGEHLEGS